MHASKEQDPELLSAFHEHGLVITRAGTVFQRSCVSMFNLKDDDRVPNWDVDAMERG